MIANSIEYQPKVMFTMSTPMALAFEDYAQKHNVDLKAAFASYRGGVFGGATSRRSSKNSTKPTRACSRSFVPQAKWTCCACASATEPSC
jgi:hypothetical protein